MKSRGTRAEVWHGTANKTAGGLTKERLIMIKGRLKSLEKHKWAKSSKNSSFAETCAKKMEMSGKCQVGSNKSHFGTSRALKEALRSP